MDPPPTTAGGATTTTVAGDTTGTLPDCRTRRVGLHQKLAAEASAWSVRPAAPARSSRTTPQPNHPGGWGVTVGLRGGVDGRGVWNTLASECFNGSELCPTRQLAIELDGEVISAPTVQQPNFTDSVQITGKLQRDEASNLARVLNSGSLPVRLETRRCRPCRPTLGKDSLRAA